MTVYAEDRPYWDTTVSPGKSQGEIVETLEDFGALQVQFSQGTTRDGRFAWLIRFTWQNRTYRFAFQPLPCHWPTKVYTRNGKKFYGSDQAKLQMGRTAFYFIKAILTAADTSPHALFGFLELPGVSMPAGLPATAAELNVERLVKALPAIEVRSLLEDGTDDDHPVEGQVTEARKE